MKFNIMCAAGAVLLAGCQSSTNTETFTARPQAASASITKAQIESCWKKAGIQGDLYKFMTPEEAAGVQPGGVFTKEKHAVFTACLSA
ncbi:50S ribosomal protein L20 [Leisingera sp. ANG59]|uniref:50S ribosomal protein L20 n=1 Tax=Leisingera sp. ANG59 TaxID=2675221 RepID=UPI0015737F34|nr:50S ribosomal protein L20 [Leisingera sp. ANG59]NSY38959.1 50S ribosomal protein L20 [Leisingera sp. ANG59]